MTPCSSKPTLVRISSTFIICSSLTWIAQNMDCAIKIVIRDDRLAQIKNLFLVNYTQ